ncbi:hypothetical protein [Luteipulveratus mongoliensis]|uniref:Lipopolysaccharide assembly protein A domain-containing protein n=1 Tax=Luteipulveratus mongoliensis TaxID=571913 RepID=A0A0K1JNE5_9MICO|nr:hypothetical protein [Luteipulveratus mongoliensis]AKU18123.1 hypothetical protein VV02_23425 [Luteipulveratus mongoliensis]
MIAVALVLLIIVALIVLWLLLASGDSADVDLSSAGLDVHVSPLVVFLLGAVSMALLLLSIRFFYWGSKRSARRRHERKDLEKQAREASKQRDAALAEREREHARLADLKGEAEGPDGEDRPLEVDGRVRDGEGRAVDGRPAEGRPRDE